ncbi:MAG: hypothetical protein HYR56_07890 [Acidobacteria bacterium]|nr:hypothetical protein [Acidobacteriota bacterium]MBI3426162.1 hypothetical protein [Acidobacteriota bacterium]
MQYLKNFRLAVSFCCLMLCVLCLSGQHGLRTAQAAEASLQLDLSAVVHGFAKAPGLPDGDLFLLPKPLSLSLNRPADGTTAFAVNAASFGAEAQTMGALANVPARGFSATQPGATVRALTCAESIWDGNLILSASDGTAGDVVRVYVQNGDGTGVQELLRFTREADGFRLSSIHPQLKLFVDNRFAMGPDTKQGTLIPFVDEAGPRGKRTGLLTFSFPMDFDSPLHGCFQLGIEITRALGAGTTSVVVTDIVVNRNRVAGDENNPGTGLLGQLTGGYPSGLPCAVECPADEGCKTICFRSAEYYYLVYCAHPSDIPYGTVLIGGVNFNRPVAARSMPPATALRVLKPQVPIQYLNREFVAAQLNLLNAGGEASHNVQEALKSPLSCYGVEFEPFQLSNGFIVNTATRLGDVFAQTRQLIPLNRPEDMQALARLFDLLNGNNNTGACN